jgi:hypothetical protein
MPHTQPEPGLPGGQSILTSESISIKCWEHVGNLWSFNSPSAFGCVLLKLLQVATIIPSLSPKRSGIQKLIPMSLNDSQEFIQS